jgi:hypothetical protein
MISKLKNWFRSEKMSVFYLIILILVVTFIKDIVLSIYTKSKNTAVESFTAITCATDTTSTCGKLKFLLCNDNFEKIRRLLGGISIPSVPDNVRHFNISTSGGYIVTGGGEIFTRGGEIVTGGANINTGDTYGTNGVIGGSVNTNGGYINTGTGDIVTSGGDINTTNTNTNLVGGGLYTGGGGIDTEKKTSPNIGNGGDLNMGNWNSGGIIQCKEIKTKNIRAGGNDGPYFYSKANIQTITITDNAGLGQIRVEGVGSGNKHFKMGDGFHS